MVSTELDAERDSVDYGPLAGLIGTWRGDKGTDMAPEPDGEVSSPFYETLVFEGCGLVDNHAEEQVLAVVRYHQAVFRLSNDKMFHNESGYYTWDFATGIVTQSFTHIIEVEGDRLTYNETTVVDIYDQIFDHTDTNTLRRESS